MPAASPTLLSVDDSGNRFAYLLAAAVAGTALGVWGLRQEEQAKKGEQEAVKKQEEAQKAEKESK